MPHTKNYGFKKPEIKSEDFILGASQVPEEVLQPDGQWTNYLPTEEIQARGNFDTQNCTAFGSNAALEIYFKRKFFLDVNFSDRYLGIMAGTRPPGNDPGKVIEVLRKTAGCIDEMLMPFVEGMTAEDYYSPDPPTPEARNKGREWLKKYYLRHEWVITPSTPQNQVADKLKQALKYSPLPIAVSAWSANEQGLYERFNDDNHWTCLVGYVDGEHWLVFDSYSPFLKKLRWDFGFTYAKRIYVGAQEEAKQKESWLTYLVEQAQLAWFRIIEAFNTMPKEIKEEPKVEPKEPEKPEEVRPEEPGDKRPTLMQWALAIQAEEGYFKPGQHPAHPNGSRSWRNSNPGNIRYGNLVRDVLGATGKDKDNFAVFKDYPAGLAALVKFLELAQAPVGQGLRSYDPEMTLYEFCKVYAPSSDGNYPLRYARHVAAKCGITIDDKIKIFKKSK